MKKMILAALGLLLLTGCGSPAVFETMSDIYAEPETPAMGRVLLELPDSAAITVMENDPVGSIYLCDGYCVTVQTVKSGDLDATLRSVTGYGEAQLTVMERKDGLLKRYECAYMAAGEGGDQVGRTLVLDDGGYHYTLTVTAPAQDAGELTQVWQEIFASFYVDTGIA